MKHQGLIDRVKQFFTGPEIQGSLFHEKSLEEKAAESLSMREIISVLKPSFNEPKVQGSLFESGRSVGVAEADDNELVQISPELLERLALRPKGVELNFIPSLFADFTELGEELKRNARRRRIVAMISVASHLVLIGLIVYLVAAKAVAPALKKADDLVTMVLPTPPPPVLNVPGNNKPGGGGGGGGKQEVIPPSAGRLPKTSSLQLVPPDPKPIEPRNDAMIAEQTVVIPIAIPQNLSLPIGDPTSIAGPPSSGPGIGGGIGTGKGTGVGSGKGGGFGPGSDGGMGGGRGGGIGSGEGTGIFSADTAGIRAPVPIVWPKPPYTEQGMKKKVMGVVVLSAVIRKDGSVDNARVVRGLGYGLDESAVETVMTRWKFQPAILNGKPVDYAVNIEVAFTIS